MMHSRVTWSEAALVLVAASFREPASSVATTAIPSSVANSTAQVSRGHLSSAVLSTAIGRDTVPRRLQVGERFAPAWVFSQSWNHHRVMCGGLQASSLSMVGTCPEGSSQYHQSTCCCGGGCCWDNCRWGNPPENCLPLQVDICPNVTQVMDVVPTCAWSDDIYCSSFRLGQYTVGQFGANACPLETTVVSHRLRCEDAALAAGYPWSNESFAESGACHWCFGCDPQVFMMSNSRGPFTKLICQAFSPAQHSNAEESFAVELAASGGTLQRGLPDGTVITGHSISSASFDDDGLAIFEGSAGVSAVVSNVTLLRLGVAVFLLTTHSGGSGSYRSHSFEGDLASGAVGLRFFGPAGEPLTVLSLLPVPLQFTIPVNYSQKLRCAYWNESAWNWSHEGVHLVQHNGDAIVCEATHLTVFAAFFAEIVEEIVEIFECSRAQAVLSYKGLQRFRRVEWITQPTAAIVSALVFACTIVLGAARLHDRRVRKRICWDKHQLLTDHQAFDPKKHPPQSLLQLLRDPRGVGMAVTRRCAQHSASLSHQILASDVKQLAEACRVDMELRFKAAEQSGAPLQSEEQSKSCSAELSRMSPKSVASSRLDRTIGERGAELRAAVLAGTDELIGSSPRQKLFGLFWALHPWLSLQHFSFSLSAASRVVILMARFFGALAVSAIFFENTGENTAPVEDMGTDCVVKGVWQTMVRNVSTGVLSSVISKVPVLVLRKFRQRQFVFRESWNETQIWRQLAVWRVLDGIFWIVICLYISFSIFFVLCFAANVNSTTELCWLLSAVTIIVKQLFFGPLVKAALYTAVSTSFLASNKRNPELIRQLTNNLHPEESISEMTPGSVVPVVCMTSLQWWSGAGGLHAGPGRVGGAPVAVIAEVKEPVEVANNSLSTSCAASAPWVCRFCSVSESQLPSGTENALSPAVASDEVRPSFNLHTAPAIVGQRSCSAS